jgi:hypothetical protein
MHGQQNIKFKQIIISLKNTYFVQTQYRSVLPYITFDNHTTTINLHLTQALRKLKEYVCYLRDRLSCLSHKVLLSKVQHPGCHLLRLTKEMPMAFAGNLKLHLSFSSDWILVVSTCMVSVTVAYGAATLGNLFPTFRNKIVVLKGRYLATQ